MKRRRERSKIKEKEGSTWQISPRMALQYLGFSSPSLEEQRATTAMAEEEEMKRNEEECAD